MEIVEKESQSPYFEITESVDYNAKGNAHPSVKAKLIVPIQDGMTADGWSWIELNKVLTATEQQLTSIIKTAMGNLQQAFPFDK